MVQSEQKEEMNAHDGNGRSLSDVDKELDEGLLVERSSVVARSDHDGDVRTSSGSPLAALDGRSCRAESRSGDDGRVLQTSVVESCSSGGDESRPFRQRQVMRLPHGSEGGGSASVSATRRRKEGGRSDAPCDDWVHPDLGQRDDMAGEGRDIWKRRRKQEGQERVKEGREMRRETDRDPRWEERRWGWVRSIQAEACGGS